MAYNDIPFSAGVMKSGSHQEPETHNFQSAIIGQQGHQMSLPHQGMQLSGADLSILEGISTEQLATIARLFQSGALPFPPQPSQPLSHVSNGATEHPSPHVRTVVDQKESQQQDVSMDSEKEDGEVDDGEIEQPSQPQGFLRPPPTGPRNSNRHSYSPARQSVHQPEPRVSGNLPMSIASTNAEVTSSGTTSNNTPGAPSQTNANQRSEMHAAALLFVAELNKAGYTFDDLAKELPSRKPLERLFQELGLSPNENSPKIEPQAASTATDRKISSSKRIMQKPAAPKDRSEYLAKLQAAKKKKSDPTVSTAIPGTPVDKTPISLPITTPISSTKENQSNGKQAPIGKANNELIRQRLEALKAEQAAKRNAMQTVMSQITPSNIEPPVQPIYTTQAAPATKKIANANQYDSSLTSQSSPVQSTHSLPGLSFLQSNTSATTSNTVAPERRADTTSTQPMNDSLGQFRNEQLEPFNISADQIGHINSAVTSKTNSRKRGVASDFYDNSSYSPGSAAAKRPFGQSRHHITSESLIITVSDDEDEDGDDDDDSSIGNANVVDKDDHDDDDEGDEMDLDESSEEEVVMKKQRASTNGYSQADVHSQSLPQSVVSSTPGTPSALERTEQELVNLRKMLAEAERRKAAVKKDSEYAEKSQLTAVTKLAVPTIASEGSDALDNGNSSVPNHSSLTFDKAAEREAEKERLRRRLQELQHARITNGSPAVKVQAVRPGVVPSFKVAEPPSREMISSGEDGSGRAEEQSSIQDNIENVNLTQGFETKSDDGATTDHSLTARSDGYANVTQSGVDAPRNESNTGSSSVDVHHGINSFVQTENDDYDSRSGTESVADDLDDVYDQPTVKTPAIRSLTSANITADESLQQTDEDMESSENSSIEDDDDVDDLYDSTNAPPPARPSNGSVEQVKRVSTNNFVDTGNDHVLPDAQPSHTTSSENLVRPKTYFTPYKSPLITFKDYRYHPEFLETVPGGFKSLTYSNKINSETALCPYDAAGGKCNDKACQFQHFDDMSLSDNDLLRVMGTEHVPVKTAEEDLKWKEGLTAVIKQLRPTKYGKDVAAIAKRIAEFRRDFVQDPTKILFLD